MAKKHGVIVYTTQACVYCRMAKQFLKDNRVEYKEIDVSEDEKAAEEMIEKSGQMGVPVIDVDGTIIVGFDRPALQNALGLK